MPVPFSWGPRSGDAGVVRSEEMGRQLPPDIGVLFLVLPTLSTRSPGLMCFFRRTIFPSHQLLLMGLQQCVPSPSGNPFHNADLWSKVGGNKPSPLPLLSPTPASLPVLCPPYSFRISVPPPTPSWKGVHREHIRCQGAEGLYWPSSVTRKAALFSPFSPLSLSGPPLLGAG